MPTTTIPIDMDVRDRLRTFGHAGMTYNDILRAMMDKMDRERFVSEMRRLSESTRDWVNLDELE